MRPFEIFAAVISPILYFRSSRPQGQTSTVTTSITFSFSYFRCNPARRGSDSIWVSRVEIGRLLQPALGQLECWAARILVRHEMEHAIDKAGPIFAVPHGDRKSTRLNSSH